MREAVIFAFLLVLLLTFSTISLNALKFDNGILEIHIPGNKPIFLIGLKNISERFRIKLLKLVEFEDSNNNSIYDHNDKKIFFINFFSLRWTLNYTSSKSAITVLMNATYANHDKKVYLKFSLEIPLIAENLTKILLRLEIYNYTVSKTTKLALLSLVSGERIRAVNSDNNSIELTSGNQTIKMKSLKSSSLVLLEANTTSALISSIGMNFSYIFEILYKREVLASEPYPEIHLNDYISSFILQFVAVAIIIVLARKKVKNLTLR